MLYKNIRQKMNWLHRQPGDVSKKKRNWLQGQQKWFELVRQQGQTKIINIEKKELITERQPKLSDVLY